MLQVEPIKAAVMNLSWPELTVFREWYAAFEAQQWDQQIAADIHAGKLDALADKVLADFEAGVCIRLGNTSL